MQNHSPQPIDRVYQQCDPVEPLDPGDSRYVPCDNVRGTGDLVARLTHAIRRSDRPMCLLFSGHRGAGKSTELLRLVDRLQNPAGNERKSFVVYFEADEEDIDVNDVDFPDLLLAIIRQIGKAFREQLKEELHPAWWPRFLDDMKQLFKSDVTFDKVEWDLKIAKFTAAIKSSPDSRVKIRESLEPNVSNLIEAANSLLDEATIRLRARGYDDLVLVVDNLDRIVLHNMPNSDFNTHEHLFINRGTQLTQLRCHVVYTLPISMMYSPKATALTTIFSRHPFTLPLIKVINRDGSDNPAGMNAVKEIIRKRLEKAGVRQAETFAPSDALDYLCRMSGGHARNLLILLRSACDYLDNLPISEHTLVEAVSGMRTDFERALNRPAMYDVLVDVDETQDLPGTEYDQTLLYNLSILEYINGEPCYAVNPIVREMSKFLKARDAKME